jgi:2-deoxy-D-gluconate 3-dehydrogenase
MAKVKAWVARAVAIAANLMVTDDLPRIVETTIRELGGLDILVNNAGMIRRATRSTSARRTGTT